MKAFLCAVVAVITALTNLFSGGELMAELKNKGDILGYAETVNVQKELVDFNVGEDDDFTVLQFSDTHFKTCISYSDLFLLEKMKAQIEQLKPDLVVVSGDMIDDGNDGLFNKAYVLRTVAEMFEQAGQYWAYIPGNNDGINYGTSADVAAYLGQYEHCLVSDEPGVSGGTQYSIDIYDDDTLTHSLVFLDTMDYDDEDEDHIYGYVHEDQVKWCEEEIACKKAENENVNVSVFLHENTPAFQKAAEDGEAYKFGYPTILKQLEQYDIPKNQPLDDVLDESGCVGLVSIGHVHPATSQCSFYNGKYYHIAPQTVLASVMITIHTAEDNYRDMYDFEPHYL